MSSKWRRFEVLLPLSDNQGTPFPGELLAEAVLEIVERFGGASYETQRVEGHWRNAGVMYRDELVKVVVDVPDSPLIESGCATSRIAGPADLRRSPFGW